MISLGYICCWGYWPLLILLGIPMFLHVWVASVPSRPSLACLLLASCLVSFLAVLALLRAAPCCCRWGLLLFGSYYIAGLGFGELCLLVLMLFPLLRHLGYCCAGSPTVVWPLQLLQLRDFYLVCCLLWCLVWLALALGCCLVSVSCSRLVPLLWPVGSRCGLFLLLLVLVPVASRCCWGLL